jgi:hypothetical protein
MDVTGPQPGNEAVRRAIRQAHESMIRTGMEREWRTLGFDRRLYDRVGARDAEREWQINAARATERRLRLNGRTARNG